nr:unnamed protein product [Spirometra erinaceieuropaei]
MMARVTDSGVVSEALVVANGVQQGCLLALTLFSPMFTAMLMDAYRDERPRNRIAYWTDGDLHNRRRMHSQSRVSTTFAHELLFADDCAPSRTPEGDMQGSIDLFVSACDKFGLVMNREKAVVMHRTQRDVAYIAPKSTRTAFNRKSWKTSSTRAVPYPAPIRLMMKWPAGFPKTTKNSAVSKIPFETVMVSLSMPSWRGRRQASCRRCCMERIPVRSRRRGRGDPILSASAVFDGY